MAPGRVLSAAAASSSAGWHRLLAASPRELRLECTLENGQCFGWHRQPGDEPVWVGVLGSRLLALRETENDCLFRCLGQAKQGADVDNTIADADADALRTELHHYFQLGTPLAPLVERWTGSDKRMSTVASALPGMRVLCQEPVECLFSFICSSNNNIGRIGGMLHALRSQYGLPIELYEQPLAPEPAEVAKDRDGAERRGVGDSDAEGSHSIAWSISAPVGHGGARDFFTFPTASALARASEEELRALGLGYRAAYVRQTAARLCERGEPWLSGLRAEVDGRVVRSSLCELPGVGPKVADCVALFSLGQVGAVPVDTHVWDIAVRDFDPTLSACGSLTPRVYDRVGDLFRDAYGPHAGWAHSLLFAAELPAFRHRLPAHIVDEMAAFRDASKAARAQAKADKQEAKASKQGGKADKIEAAQEKAPRSPTKKASKGAQQQRWRDQDEPAGGATPRGMHTIEDINEEPEDMPEDMPEDTPERTATERTVTERTTTPVAGDDLTEAAAQNVVEAATTKPQPKRKRKRQGISDAV